MSELPSQPWLAVVIVTWNVRALVLDAVKSVVDDLKNGQIRAEIWIVDNQSSDGTAEALRNAYPNELARQVHVLDPGENVGFAAGNNYALRAIGFPDSIDLPDYVLLLNPDTIVRPGALNALIGGLESSNAGLAGARLVYGDGSFQHSAFGFPGLMQLMFDLFPAPARLYESSLNGRYPRFKYQGDEPFEIDHPLGATFLLRREVICQTGMFDEQFHLYCEEIDWAMRIKAAGWRAVCVPSAEVVHFGGQSTSQVQPESITNLWKARLQLYRKHYSPLIQAIAKVIIRIGMNRLIQRTARNSAESDETRQALVKAYIRVISLTHEL